MWFCYMAVSSDTLRIITAAAVMVTATVVVSRRQWTAKEVLIAVIRVIYIM